VAQRLVTQTGSMVKTLTHNADQAIIWAHAHLDFARNQEYKFGQTSLKLDLEIKPKFDPNWLLCIPLMIPK